MAVDRTGNERMAQFQRVLSQVVSRLSAAGIYYERATWHGTICYTHIYREGHGGLVDLTQFRSGEPLEIRLRPAHPPGTPIFDRISGLLDTKLVILDSVTKEPKTPALLDAADFDAIARSARSVLYSDLEILAEETRT